MAGTTTYLGITYPTSTDYVKDGATAIQTVATGFDSAVAIPTYNAQTGTTYTFALTDVGKTVTASNAAASTYTIPPTASVAWPTGTTLEITNLGAGVVTFAAGAGVTVTNTAATLAQYASAELIRTGLNAWTVTPKGGGGATGLTLLSTTTFSGVASQASPTNTFTSTYRNYRIILSNLTSTVADTEFRLRLRAAGTDTTTSTYQRYGISGATASPSTETSFFLSLLSTTATNQMFTIMDFFNPQKATRTQTQYFSMTTSSNFQAAAFQQDNTVFDAVNVYPASGNISGQMQIFGYNE